MVGQRFGPHGVDFEARSLASAGSVNPRLFLEHDRPNSKCYEDCDKDSSNIEVTLHGSPAPLTRWYAIIHDSLAQAIYHFTLSVIATINIRNMSSRIAASLTLAVPLVAVILMAPPGAVAHDIPNDVTVQA